jgi:cation/acetate symporter
MFGATNLSQSDFKAGLNRVYIRYTSGFIVFVLLVALLEQMGLPKNWIGYLFLFATVMLYAGIGMMSRTNDAAEYYVAGRRVPAMYNGMATGADWMSAASFIGMAGTLYLNGFGGLAYIIGWTGGYCLVALFLAPYLRQFGQFTIPDFLGARYEGNLPRIIGAIAAILCSFTYLVAQVYGVGLITTRLTGLAFEIGIFAGLTGILVCSFLGGMRAVTWTQVAQYVILIIAYLLPVIWLSVKHTGIPVPQIVYGYTLEKVAAREAELLIDPKELEVREIFRVRSLEAAAKLNDVRSSMAADRGAAQKRLDDLRAANGPLPEIIGAATALATLPKSEYAATAAYNAAKNSNRVRANPPIRHAEPFAESGEGGSDVSRKNFLALVFCLMIGTAGLPHILMRYYTTPSVKEARESVGWSLFFIFLLYFTAPALAVLAKFEIYTVLVNTPFDKLPEWIARWSSVDKSLLSVEDINRDGILQLAEIFIGGDIIVLATPEIGGMPYVVSGLVAAGGLAAALSTADGLLLTISNALSHDIYYKILDPNATTTRRVMVSKLLLLVVALCAAYVAAQKPADILFLVSAAFSIAAAAFFPVLALGIFWKRANRWGASAGMLAGLGITFYYMLGTQPWLYGLTHANPLTPALLKDNTWWDIAPISAGLFGVPVGFAVTILVSLVTRAPGAPIQRMVDQLRYPQLDAPAHVTEKTH